MIGFTFNGTHSGSMGCWMVSTDRTVRPEKRVYSYSIPGRSGTIKTEDGTFEDRQIKLRLSFTGTALTRASLRQRVRSVASWLSGSGQLRFDDEPGVYYKATVQSGISLEQATVTGTCEVVFLCDPFAYAGSWSKETATGASIPTSGGVQVVCVSQGTVVADCEIQIKALSAIDTLHIGRNSVGWITLTDLNMAANATLDIYTENLTVWKSGSNAMALLSDASDLSVLRMQSGTNTYTIYGTASTANITIQWKDRWL